MRGRYFSEWYQIQGIRIAGANTTEGGGDKLVGLKPKGFPSNTSVFNSRGGVGGGLDSMLGSG